MSDFLTGEDLLRAYASGIFPMAETQDDPELFWVDPRFRGVFPLDNFHLSRSMRKCLRTTALTVTVDQAFQDCVAGCGARPETWINGQLHRLYGELFQAGFAHSVEVWNQDRLVGGVFGLAIGGAFFGESMFSRETNASKIALAFLVDRLRFGGFQVFDTQFITPHLASLGAIEISRDEYQKQLERALEVSADFFRLSQPVQASEVLQRSTQTS